MRQLRTCPSTLRCWRGPWGVSTGPLAMPPLLRLRISCTNLSSFPPPPLLLPQPSFQSTFSVDCRLNCSSSPDCLAYVDPSRSHQSYSTQRPLPSPWRSFRRGRIGGGLTCIGPHGFAANLTRSEAYYG